MYIDFVGKMGGNNALVNWAWLNKGSKYSCKLLRAVLRSQSTQTL